MSSSSSSGSEEEEEERSSLEGSEEENKQDQEGPTTAPTYGCKHYRRRCSLVAPCCGEVFVCRLCHDEAKECIGKHSHTLDRKSVTEVVCLVCETRQKVSNECTNCGTQFGKYFCEECRLFDDEDKGQYHCEGCGICRVGGRENFFHCYSCKGCFAVEGREEHKCKEWSSLHQNCPVCFEFLFSSTKEVTVLPCSHPIHRLCLLKMRNQMLGSREPWVILKANSCPTCSRSVCDLDWLWDQLDEEIVNTPMPEEYADKKVDVLCNDCGVTSRGAPFHVLGTKCLAEGCRSYNTRRL